MLPQSPKRSKLSKEQSTAALAKKTPKTGKKYRDHLLTLQRLMVTFLLPSLSNKPEAEMDAVAAQLAKRRPLTDEQQAYYDNLTKPQRIVLHRKCRGFKKRRPKNRMRQGWRDGSWVPTLPDVPAKLQAIDNRIAGIDATELATRSINSFAEQIMSQHGEDGITYELLKRVGMTTRQCIELGCGHNGGNTGFLVVGLQYRGLLMDGNKEYTDILQATLAANPYPHAEGTVVKQGWITRDSINKTFTDAGFTGEIDYLGIDLDGVDWWIWDAIDVVSPRLVCIEFNAMFGDTEAVTIPYRESFCRGERDKNGHHIHPKGFLGASLMALEYLARKKGYRLVASAPRSSNAYFIRNDLASGTPAISVQDAYRAPYKARQEELRQRFIQNGLWTVAVESGGALVHVSPDGTPCLM